MAFTHWLLPSHPLLSPPKKKKYKPKTPNPITTQKGKRTVSEDHLFEKGGMLICK